MGQQLASVERKSDQDVDGALLVCPALPHARVGLRRCQRRREHFEDVRQRFKHLSVQVFAFARSRREKKVRSHRHVSWTGHQRHWLVLLQQQAFSKDTLPGLNMFY